NMIPVIKTAIAGLASNPRPQGCKKLKGEAAFRIRIGDYRIIYEIDESAIHLTVVSVGHRKDVYK
ncbi:MAG: type II toxin-antitoxin system RelE/ParE family toxin, partial [Bacteroidales bacterium]|nr:type II toxin-antitoxin system RelE/ParE family toxin [Bacteroidales bacterium]